jgi:outer membrane protein assembly factor BamD (BamD/ComL family)
MRTNEMTRKLIICFALLISMSCSAMLRTPQNARIKNRIAQAEYLASTGNYKDATALLEQTTRESPENPWQDKVLFSLGRLYASDENPGMDFARSLFYLKRLNIEFPKSRFRAEAQVWVGLLEKLYSLEVDLKARTEDQLSLEREIAKLKADNRELESRDNKLSELESLIQAQKTAIEALRQQLKKMKEIDIQSEKKAKRIK